MLTKNDLQAIKGIFKEETEPLKHQLDTVESKVEVVNKRVQVAEKTVKAVSTRIDNLEEKLEQSIRESQEDTVEVLSQLITTGLESHEKKLQTIEDHLQIPHS